MSVTFLPAEVSVGYVLEWCFVNCNNVERLDFPSEEQAVAYMRHVRQFKGIQQIDLTRITTTHAVAVVNEGI